MGWSLGYDNQWQRDIGYGVPCQCDYPGCTSRINRGLSYVCGGEPYGGDRGCGLYFCSKHLFPILCERCFNNQSPFRAKPDIPDWIRHKLTDPSWREWRELNPEKVESMKLFLEGHPSP